MTPAPQRDGERATLTVHFILEATDDKLDAWKFLGQVAARDREHALKLFFPDPEKVEKKPRVAVTINAWKPVMVGKKPVPPKLEIGEVLTMPAGAPAPGAPLAAVPEPDEEIEGTEDQPDQLPVEA